MRGAPSEKTPPAASHRSCTKGLRNYCNCITNPHARATCRILQSDPLYPGQQDQGYPTNGCRGANFSPEAHHRSTVVPARHAMVSLRSPERCPHMAHTPQDGTTSRRQILRHGKKLAYVAPVVIVAMQAQPAFSASGN